MSQCTKDKVLPKVIGHHIEGLAAQYLSERGMKIVQTNFTCKAGEIDLIGWHDADTLVFVEVRYRHTREYGHPLETVTSFKQKKIMRAAYFYLQRYKNNPPYCRFDVLSAIGPTTDLDWEWIPDAFQL